MGKAICVYSSSSCVVDQIYFDMATELGRQMGIRGHSLVFGAGIVGLMGATAKAVHKEMGHVIGVIPEALNVSGVVYHTCDELIVTEGLRERKATMDQRSDAFIALPGGFGTLEELLEIITLKQLHYHNKPVVILNINGFYDYLIELFERIIEAKFAKKECKELFFVASDANSALDYIEQYTPTERMTKWMTEINI